MTLPTVLQRTKSISKKSIVPLKNFSDEFLSLRTLCSGHFSEILLVRDRTTKERLVLKSISNESDFLVESSLNYFLSPHPHIVTCYNVVFHRENGFLFPQEYAPYGDLSRHVFSPESPRRTSMLKESQVKMIAKQLASALEFIHSLNLVHRQVVAENVLVFKPDLSTVKLSDFGRMCSEDVLVTKEPTDDLDMGEYSSPEMTELVSQESYYCHRSCDVWQLGVLLMVCLTGEFPWDTADPLTDARFSEYIEWHKRKNLRQPDSFSPFTPRLIRLLKRLLEPKWKKRSEITEVNKYLEDDWIRKGALTPTGGILSLSRRNSSFRKSTLERKSSNTSGTTGSSCRIKRKRSSAGSSRRVPKKTPVVVARGSTDESNSSHSCSLVVTDGCSDSSSGKIIEDKVEKWILNSHNL